MDEGRGIVSVESAALRVPSGLLLTVVNSFLAYKSTAILSLSPSAKTSPLGS